MCEQVNSINGFIRRKRLDVGQEVERDDNIGVEEQMVEPNEREDDG